MQHQKTKSYVRKHLRTQRKAKCWLNRKGYLPKQHDIPLKTRQHFYDFFNEKV